MASLKLRTREGEVCPRASHVLQGPQFYGPVDELNTAVLGGTTPSRNRRTAIQRIGRRLRNSAVGLVIGFFAVTIAFRAAENFERSLATFLAGRAQDQFDTGRFNQSAATFRRAIRIEPNDAALHFGLARAEERLGKYDRALGEDRRAIAIDPVFFPAYLHSAAIYDEKLSDPQSSLKVLLSALDQHLSDVSAKYYLLTEVGRVELGLGHPEFAKRSYVQAIQLAPTHGSAHCLLAKVLDDEGSWDQALNQWGECAAMSNQSEVDQQWLETAHQRLKSPLLP